MRPDFLSPSRQPFVRPHHRAKVVAWAADSAQTQFLRRQTLHAAVGLLDRVLAASPALPLAELGTLCAACLSLAAKNEEVHPPLLEDLVALRQHTAGLLGLLESTVSLIRQANYAGICLAQLVLQLQRKRHQRLQLLVRVDQLLPRRLQLPRQLFHPRGHLHLVILSARSDLLQSTRHLLRLHLRRCESLLQVGHSALSCI